MTSWHHVPGCNHFDVWRADVSDSRSPLARHGVLGERCYFYVSRSNGKFGLCVRTGTVMCPECPENPCATWVRSRTLLVC